MYLTYGKCFSFMTLGWMAGLVILHARQRASAGRLEKWGFRLAFAGTVLGTIGGIVAYWIGSVWWGAVGIAFGAFLVPALLLFGTGFPLYGVGALRAKVVPNLAAWLLIVGGLPGMIALDIVLGQLALALLPLNLAWVVLGYALFSDEGGLVGDVTGHFVEAPQMRFQEVPA